MQALMFNKQALLLLREHCFGVYYQHPKESKTSSKQSIGRLLYHNSAISPQATECGDKRRDNTKCLVSVYTELSVCCCSLHVTAVNEISRCRQTPVLPCLNNSSMLNLEGGEADISAAAQSCSGRGNKVRQAMPETENAPTIRAPLVLSHFHWIFLNRRFG